MAEKLIRPRPSASGESSEPASETATSAQPAAVDTGTSSHADRYEVGEKLGEGRFATTWAVTDRETGQRCVLKRTSVRGLLEAHVDSLSGKTTWEKAHELFEREAEVLAQLDHPGIPRYVDSFIDGSDLCLVQERIEGTPLADLMRTRRFDEKQVRELAVEIADILAYLHSMSPPVVHRDLKPSNIIVRADGTVALVDFGAALDSLRPDGGSTIVGTFGYMPLEQYEGRATPASDVYALGMTLIELLTRKKPTELERKALTLDFRPYLNVKGGFADLLESMVQMDPALRPKDGSAVADALRAPGRVAQKAPAKKASRSSALPWVAAGLGAAVAAGVGLLVIEAQTGQNVLKDFFDGFSWWWWIPTAVLARQIFVRRRRRRRRRDRHDRNKPGPPQAVA